MDIETQTDDIHLSIQDGYIDFDEILRRMRERTEEDNG